MLKEEIEQVEAIARMIAKEEIALALKPTEKKVVEKKVEDDESSETKKEVKE